MLASPRTITAATSTSSHFQPSVRRAARAADGGGGVPASVALSSSTGTTAQAMAVSTNTRLASRRSK